MLWAFANWEVKKYGVHFVEKLGAKIDPDPFKDPPKTPKVVPAFRCGATGIKTNGYFLWKENMF